jgi:hypothetical protein
VGHKNEYLLNYISTRNQANEFNEKSERNVYNIKAAINEKPQTRTTRFILAFNVLKTTKDYKNYSHGTQQKGLSH